LAKPLRSQLNQVRAWVRQGRTDAWIAHQLEVSTSELREFRRRHELSADDEGDETDLRDEIEAEIEAATREEELAAEAEPDDSESDSAGSDAESDSDDDSDDGEGSDPSDRGEGSDRTADGARKPRRRRRRGGRGRSGRAGASMQASFDHGEEGYGLWLDPAIADDPVYSEHWAGHRPVEVTVEPDRIVIKRTGDDANGSDTNGDSDSDSDSDSDD
jgi:hypothetical protein